MYHYRKLNPFQQYGDHACNVRVAMDLQKQCGDVGGGEDEGKHLGEGAAHGESADLVLKCRRSRSRPWWSYGETAKIGYQKWISPALDADQSKSIVAAKHGSIPNAVFMSTASASWRELVASKSPATRFEKCAIFVRVVYCANMIDSS